MAAALIGIVMASIGSVGIMAAAVECRWDQDGYQPAKMAAIGSVDQEQDGRHPREHGSWCCALVEIKTAAIGCVDQEQRWPPSWASWRLLLRVIWNQDGHRLAKMAAIGCVTQGQDGRQTRQGGGCC